MAPGLNDPPLMERQGAETAGTKASPVAYQAELDLRNGRNASGCLVGGMIRSHIRIGIHIIHFLAGQGFGRRILHHPDVVRIGLCQPLSRIGICISVLNGKASCIGHGISLYLCKGRQGFIVVNIFRMLGL